jgi:dienelactone hydrolase
VADLSTGNCGSGLFASARRYFFRQDKKPAARLAKPLVVVDDVTTVEVRIPASDVVVRIDEVRRWLSAQRIQPLRVISTGNSGETVVLCEFNLSGEAEKFALEFSGTLV